MKRTLFSIALLAPAIASAQIYPLHVYATVARDTGQPLKFMQSPENGIYVGLCNKRPDGTYLCDLAKDGKYTTDTGLTFRTKNMGQLFSADGNSRCKYDDGSKALDCD